MELQQQSMCRMNNTLSTSFEYTWEPGGKVSTHKGMKLSQNQGNNEQGKSHHMPGDLDRGEQKG